MMENAILAAWEEFIAGGTKPGGIRSEIAASWQRCRNAGVDPEGPQQRRKQASEALSATLCGNQELIEVAKPFMSKLYQFVKGSGFVVVLADAHGYIMDMFSDDEILRNSLTDDFFPGACWSEKAVGTNAIGTALVARQPIQVSGPEHYCLTHHRLTCSAAPIFWANGEVAAVLDMSGDHLGAHLHTLGMVVASAEAIMAELAILQKNRELVLINNRLTNIFNTMSDGVLVVDQSGIVTQVNPVAKSILGKPAEVLGVPLEQLVNGKNPLMKRLLDKRESFTDIEIMLDTWQGLSHFLASGEPVKDERGLFTGCVIVLRPIKKIQNLINRFSGYYSTLQFSDIIGESSEILEAIRVSSMAAMTTANILLQGESGTGKDIFAQAIHNRSPQQNGPFIAVNCGVIPRELIGSELFGYSDGAFTGAKRGGKPGKFELASGGTLFLDEIGDMPLEQQVSLLRVLQDKTVTRIGSSTVIPVNVRVICATNKNLLQEMEKGFFRQDLYYRLNVISIAIPPLRNRQVDIGLLFRHFVKIIGRERGANFDIRPEVITCLEQYRWPGNVRELQNVAERTVSLTEDHIISPVHLPDEIRFFQPLRQQEPTVGTNGDALQTAFTREQRRKLHEAKEKQDILKMLTTHGGNISQVAREMGLSRNTLYRKMRQNGIEN